MRRTRSPQVRIIGGKWKARKLLVATGVRPTPDRAKVTLFNWLTPKLPGARVLDLFAGTGALGLEALSRGAAAATLVERDRGVARLLAEQCASLAAADATVVCGSALPWLSRQPPDVQWDVVFLDAPFDADLHVQAVRAVAPRLADGGALYVEVDAQHQLADLVGETGLAVRREARLGGVCFGLLASEA